MAVICMLCGKEVEEKHGATPLQEWFVDGAVLGERIDLRGHKTCLENVNKLVVIPNRVRLMGILDEVKKERDQSSTDLPHQKGKGMMKFLRSLEDALRSDHPKD